MPLIFGIRMSHTTTSSMRRFSPVLKTSMARCPSSASSTSYPAFCNIIRATRRISGSSSTTKTRPFPVRDPNKRSDLYSVMTGSFVNKVQGS